MTNRQIWFDDIQPVETLRFEPIEERYVKVILSVRLSSTSFLWLPPF